MFQSQTGSQALSDYPIQDRLLGYAKGFNPKREARPSQTLDALGLPSPQSVFQSQTGSQALSDNDRGRHEDLSAWVSIPNGKPGPLRPAFTKRGNTVLYMVSIPNGKPGPLRRICDVVPGAKYPFQSQTGSQALSDCAGSLGKIDELNVSIPNGKPGPLRRGLRRPGRAGYRWFQSQTGSQALSDQSRYHS